MAKRMSDAAKARRNAKRREEYEPVQPKPPRLLEGRDFFCGWCAGHKIVPCDNCLDGCWVCHGVGQVACPDCNGGAIEQQPPEWM